MDLGHSIFRVIDQRLKRTSKTGNLDKITCRSRGSRLEEGFKG